MHSDGERLSATVAVRAERQDGSTPGIKVTWNTTEPPECVESIRVEFRESSSATVVRSYNTTDASEREVIQTDFQCGTTYHIRVVVMITGLGVAPLNSNEVQVRIGGNVTTWVKDQNS